MYMYIILYSNGEGPCNIAKIMIENHVLLEIEGRDGAIANVFVQGKYLKNSHVFPFEHLFHG